MPRSHQPRTGILGAATRPMRQALERIKTAPAHGSAPAQHGTAWRGHDARRLQLEEPMPPPRARSATPHHRLASCASPPQRRHPRLVAESSGSTPANASARNLRRWDNNTARGQGFTFSMRLANIAIGAELASSASLAERRPAVWTVWRDKASAWRERLLPDLVASTGAGTAGPSNRWGNRPAACG